MTPSTRDDAPTLLAMGVLVSIIASLAHEALGHGVGCAIDGGRITLITFLVFRCAGAGVIADGGGPIGVLIVGGIALALASMPRIRSTWLRLFLLNLGALSLLWACGQAIEEALDGSDDWGHVAADIGWPASWHAVVGAIGVFGYAATLRLAGRLGRILASGRPWRLWLPYLAACLSAIALGALWHKDRTGSALDGLLTFGLAPIGYLFVAWRLAQRPMVADTMERNPLVLGLAVASWLAFALTIALGVGSLA